MNDVKLTAHIKYANRNEIYESVKNATESEFRQVANKLFSTVNKRIQRIENSNVISPALNALYRKRGNAHFSAKQGSFDDLKKEYAQAYAFYKLETGTVSGSRMFTNNLKSKIGDRINDREYINYIFDTMHTLQDRFAGEIFKGLIGTNDLLQDVIEATIDKERSEFEKTEAERDAFISEQVERIASQINNMVENSVHDIDKGLSNAFNKLW